MTFLTRKGLPNQSYNTKGKKGGQKCMPQQGAIR